MSATINAIPEMTHPYGKVWQQPADIRIAPMNDTHVLLTRHQFEGLHEYSASNPSGVYDGKCWKREQCGPRRPGEPPRQRRQSKWFLCWYAPCSDPKSCITVFREIRIGRIKGGEV